MLAPALAHDALEMPLTPERVLNHAIEISDALDKAHRASWMRDAPAVDTIEEFQPWFALLMKRSDFVWVYAAGNAYNVWSPPYSERFPPVLARAKDEARAGRGEERE